MTRVAVVTGAARGIGAATVLAMARRGWNIVAVDRCSDDPRLPYAMGTRADLDAVIAGADSLYGAAGGVIGVAADTCDEPAMTAAMQLARSRFGGLDVVVAAAGIIAGGTPLWEAPAAQHEVVIDVDLTGVIVAARAGIPLLLEQPEPRTGRFVAVASAAGTRGLPMLAAYCAAKAGVLGLVRALAVELGGSGVTANAVSPGSTDTPILAESARLYGLADAAVFAAQQPFGRLLEPAEVAEGICWLAAPESSGTTGTNLTIDGGLAL